ncbi:LysM peptidoglycan-binding domain-containing protein [Paenibacillus nasutitermitis]|uniref:LysM domain-containing protein n=1 Tax=Paenibacillus nasutitermitis TaxID=1652958 RepID=A0A916ZG79_9BACL|nr:LysM peptidoglycan-binding domain-containing protein [Paenibacillus nasutitermitis]GGD96268.1 hypothetical protein GCM10010911_63700 [Paenibacillus nasutitermitis]
MNKKPIDSYIGPRGSRSKKDRTMLLIMLASGAIFIIICGISYGIFTKPLGSGPKQTAAEIEQPGNQPAGDNEDDGPAPDLSAGDGQASGNASAGNEPAGQTEQGESESAATEETGLDTEDKPASTEPTGTETADKTETSGSGALAGEDSTGAADNGPKEVATQQTSSSAKTDKPAGTTAKLPTSYVVKKGDTLRSISMKFYGTKEYIELLAERNNILLINDMKVGDTLTIPALSSASGSASGKKQDNSSAYAKVTLPATYLVQPGDTLYNISKQFYDSKDYVELIAAQNKLKATEDLKAGSSLTIPALPKAKPGSGSTAKPQAVKNHTVLEGETLSSISRTYYGSSKYAKTISEYNHVANSDTVKAGDVLKIPKL